MNRQIQLPPDFLWGVATSSYQIEGAVAEDGRGESIWDRFSHTPGKIDNGDNGDVACDHYHRYADDIELMAELGVGAYRFSVAWPRVFPDGGTQLNRKGLDFYQRLTDRLLDRGIAPAVTLYHWDLPQALQDRGGWTNRDTVARFSHYAETLYDALGDRVELWMTHNEPWVAGFLGDFRGVHAPGSTDLQAALRTIHHLLLSHGEAVAAYRASGRSGQIGIVLSLHPTYPVDDTQEDRAAAEGSDGYTNRWFLDPIFRASYPADMIERFQRAGARIDFVEDTDLAAMAEPTDFLGVNYYFPRRVSASGAEFGWKVKEHPDPGVPTTALGWEITPSGLTETLLRLRAEYGDMPFYVTENGAVFADEVEPDGRVNDPGRVDFLRRHFAAAQQAISAGVDLRGYFVWSLLDNFEWAFGYSPRFGIVYVDFQTQRRIPKDSFAFYRDVIATNSFELPDGA